MSRRVDGALEHFDGALIGTIVTQLLLPVSLKCACISFH